MLISSCYKVFQYFLHSRRGYEMEEYDDLAMRSELNIEMLLMLLEICIDGRKTLIAILERRANELSRKDILKLVRRAPIGCGTGLMMATELLSHK